MPGVKALELRGFEFFFVRTAPEMSYFDFDFWPRLVLQLSRSDPLVLHAAIALGTLHENEEALGMPISKHRVSDARYCFAISQYNTALSLLGGQTTTNALRNRASVLATCLIFIHVELLRGAYDTAIKHISGGLKILKNSVTPEDKSNPEIAILEAALARLDLQCAHFSGEHVERPSMMINADLCQLDECRPLISRAPFARLIEIKNHFDILVGISCKLFDMARNFRLGECCSAHAAHFGASCNFLDVFRPVCEEIETSEVDLAMMQSRLAAYHREYMAEVDALLTQDAIVNSSKHWRSAILLKMHLMATLMQINTCLSDDIELAYDALDGESVEMMSLAETFMGSSPIQSEYPVAQRPLRCPTLLTDWGIFPPLFHIAIKCRHPLLRRRAISLMESWPHREGFWDASLGAAIAKAIMELEEAGNSTEQLLQNRSLVQRMSNVWAGISDDQTTVTIAYDRKVKSSNGGRETLTVHI